MTDRSKATTHAADCWSWGRGHYECAVREIERLREELSKMRADPVAYAVFADNGNIRIWSSEPLNVPGCVPLYTASAAEDPANGAGDDWRIDHTAGRPILVYQNCSVIEAEQAEYVLRLIEADRQQRGGDVIDDMRAAVRFAPSSAYWSERLREFFGPDAREGIDALEKQLREARAALAAQPAVNGYTCTVPDDCETLHWRGQILSMNELASMAQPAASAEPAALDRDTLVDLIADHLSGTYHCTRVWSAWSVGTMSEDDFEDVSESDTPSELADAILARLAAPVAAQAQPVADREKLIDAVEAAISVGPMDPIHSEDRHAWGNAWHMEPPSRPRADHVHLQGRRACARRAVDAVLAAQAAQKGEGGAA